MRSFQIYACTHARTHAHTHTHTHTPRASSRDVRKGTVVETRAVEADAVAKASVVARALQYNNTSNLLQKGNAKVPACREHGKSSL
jgi:hypothetical protein